MRNVYLDNAATTAPSARAMEASADGMTSLWANPSSVYSIGNDTAKALAKARREVAEGFGAGYADGSVIFTGSGAEANNFAIFGSVYAKKRKSGSGGTRGAVLITDSEHPSVDLCAKRLGEDGFAVIRIPTAGGAIDTEALKSALTPDVILASFMLANNETGALYDVKNAAAAVRKAAPGALIHTDAVQAFMKADTSPRKLGVDMISASAHKIGALKGVGALWVRNDILKSKKLIPYLIGGGQEDTMRSGTENMPGILAFAAAVEEARAAKDERATHIDGLCAYLLSRVSERLPDVRANLPKVHLPYVVSLTLPGIRSETALNFLSSKGIFVSAGSACSARSGKPSHVLSAFGLTEREADSTLRISFSHNNTTEDIDILCDALAEGISSLARMR